MRLLYLLDLCVSRVIIALFAGLAIVSTVACDKVPLLAPTESTINLTVSTTTLASNGTAQVIATVIEKAGTPVQNGTVVTFTGSLGVFDPPDASTVNGKATTTFRANGSSGTAKIGAVSGGAKATEIEVKIGGAAAENVTLRAEPSSVSTNGGTVQLVATVVDASGNALPGTPVIFSTDNGQLGANSVTTDSNGEARTTLQTNRTSIVKARVGTKEGQLTINASTAPTVSISFQPSSPLAGLPVTFTVTPGSAGTTGNPVRNVVLDFGDGTSHSFGAISGASTVQHVYNRADTYTVTATATDTAGQQSENRTSLTVQRPIVGVSVTGPATGDAGASVTFTVAVSNSSNVPITTVRLEFGDGTATTLPPSGGSAPHTYAQPGDYTVRATAVDQAGNSYTGTHLITIRPRAAIQVELDAAPTENQNAFTCTTVYPKTCQTSMDAFVPPPGAAPGIRVVFTARIAGTLAPAAASFSWNYGDGQTETTTASSRDHFYTARGTYVITVRVTTTDGNTGEQRLTLIIS
jgi:PKD repeat protein